MSVEQHACVLPPYAVGNRTQRQCRECGQWWQWAIDLRYRFTSGAWAPMIPTGAQPGVR